MKNFFEWLTSASVLNVLSNIVGFLVFMYEPLRAYFEAEPFKWDTFLMLLIPAIISWFFKKKEAKEDK